ncbi:PEGA domain-containing protein [Chondromyces apiculatus]|uniref:PEGA domain-containing protein n=1 Tax=Chondromyces apiculatus DSM 436 TaxID=1192034 RepID=A0A017TB89_9BACT|nr:PEGA domain-containing protein [Chondromyces apiculatus]EYF06182.1 Hypothetical protein CAP_2372 [Chondromyces apiculatus DSM 436]
MRTKRSCTHPSPSPWRATLTRTALACAGLACVALPCGASAAAAPPPPAAPPAAAPATPSTAAATRGSGPAGQERPSATAAGATTGDEDLAQMARVLFERGVAAWDAEKYDECRLFLTAAWRMKQHQQISLNLGSCEYKLKRYVDAGQHLGHYLREAPATPDTRERRAAAQAMYDEALKHVVRIEVRITPPDAEVLLDGSALGRGPFAAELVVAPGPHALELRAEGHETERLSLTGAAGTREEVSRTLKPVAVAPPPGGSSAPPPPPPQHPRMPLVIGGFALSAAVGLGVGTLLHVLAAQESSSADDLLAHLRAGGTRCDPAPGDAPCAALRHMRENQDALANGGTALFIGSGVIVAGTAAYLLVTKLREKPRATTSLQVLPQVGLRGGGLAIGGTF